MRLTQDNFDKLVDLMNHNITTIKIDITWLKRLMWANFALLSTIGGALLTIAYKL